MRARRVLWRRTRWWVDKEENMNPKAKANTKNKKPYAKPTITKFGNRTLMAGPTAGAGCFQGSSDTGGTCQSGASPF